MFLQQAGGFWRIEAHEEFTIFLFQQQRRRWHDDETFRDRFTDQISRRWREEKKGRKSAIKCELKPKKLGQKKKNQDKKKNKNTLCPLLSLADSL